MSAQLTLSARPLETPRLRRRNGYSATFRAMSTRCNRWIAILASFTGVNQRSASSKSPTALTHDRALRRVPVFTRQQATRLPACALQAFPQCVSSGAWRAAADILKQPKGNHRIVDRRCRRWSADAQPSCGRSRSIAPVTLARPPVDFARRIAPSFESGGLTWRWTHPANDGVILQEARFFSTPPSHVCYGVVVIVADSGRQELIEERVGYFSGAFRCCNREAHTLIDLR
jgi:hypothetical protein